MLISDEPLLSSQPLLSGQLPFPRGWPLNRGSTVYNIFVHVHKNLLNLLEDGKGSLVMLKPDQSHTHVLSVCVCVCLFVFSFW